MPHALPAPTTAGVLALLASFAVLWLTGVSGALFLSQGLAALLAAASAWVMAQGVRRVAPHVLAPAWAFAALLLLATPPLLADRLPARWLRLGSLVLYLAPLLLPPLLVLVAPMVRASGRLPLVVATLLGLTGLALAVQPDLSQVLAWSLAVALLLARQRARGKAWVLAALPLVAASFWAASLPDPLQPVPHVEQVFALAWRASAVAGVAVAAVALTLLGALSRAPHAGWALAGYYGALFLASLADRTPAPLLGYGAAPWLGFGLACGALPAQRNR